MDVQAGTLEFEMGKPRANRQVQLEQPDASIRIVQLFASSRSAYLAR